MSANERKVPGGHYSGRNPVPNIQRFIETLDSEKKQRDKKLEDEMNANKLNGEVRDHAQGQPVGIKGTRKTVTDPTTGNQVQIEDVDANFMKAVKDPVVSMNFYNHQGQISHANIGPAICAKCKSRQRYREFSTTRYNWLIQSY